MAAARSDPFLNPNAIAETGERIYRDKYQQEYEANHFGKFLAIDIRAEKHTLEALRSRP